MRDHVVQFYEHEDRLVEQVGAFIGAGLEGGGAGVVIARRERLQLLARRLGPAGSNGKARYLALDAAELLGRFMIGGAPDAQRFGDVVGEVLSDAAGRGNGEVRAYGEMVALLCAEGNHQAAVQLEELWNDLARVHRFSLLCSYPLDAFPRREHQALFEHVCAAHSRVLPVLGLDGDAGDREALSRTIARLEHRASALDAEVAARKQVEEALRERERQLAAFADELEQRVDELADLGRRKDEFLAMLGHELRNPLAPIVTSLQLMRLYHDDPAQLARCRNIIERQTGLIVRLVDDLLDVSRITRGRIELKRGPIELRELVAQAVEVAASLINERGHHLAMDLPPEPVRFSGDAARLAQVLANLLTNAAKYTDVGGLLQLAARCEDGELVLSVRDNGIGMTEQLRGRVFNLFEQGSDVVDRSRGGLGVGLTLVRSLVALHGGRVEAHSRGPGCGSEFVVRIPLRPVMNGTVSEPPADALAAAAADARRILVVDDNVDAAQSLGELLRMRGHSVSVLHDGAAALLEAAQLRPEIVILDLAMPGLDGYELARRLRADAATQPALLVAVTGHAQQADGQRARDAGFDRYYAKPLDLGELEALLQRQSA